MGLKHICFSSSGGHCEIYIHSSFLLTSQNPILVGGCKYATLIEVP